MMAIVDVAIDGGRLGQGSNLEALKDCEWIEGSVGWAKAQPMMECSKASHCS